MYGEAGYSGHNTDDAINFGGANVWVRSEPEMLQRMEIPISDGVDDVELLDNGRVYTGSGDIEMTFGQYPNEHHEKVGLAFRSIGLKQGIQVAHAEIQFTATASDNELVELEISAVAVDSFVDWETHGMDMPLGNGDPSRDPTTGRDSSGDAILMTDPPFGINDVTDAVTWLPRPWSKGQSGRAQATTELKDVINAIVGRPNWREGNDMGFIIAHTCPTTGYGSTCTSVQMGADSASNQRLCEARVPLRRAVHEWRWRGGLSSGVRSRCTNAGRVLLVPERPAHSHVVQSQPGGSGEARRLPQPNWLHESLWHQPVPERRHMCAKQVCGRLYLQLPKHRHCRLPL